MTGDFQGWDNTTHPMNDDGVNGDLVAADGVHSLDSVVFDSGIYGWKVTTCGDWNESYPANNAWLTVSSYGQLMECQQ
ncbi:MAG: choice-of-anchor X domain-containing protein [Polyangia bacterium]|nr:choice-of-anchor X domain-containing protein [Polyangia bacterium]